LEYVDRKEDPLIWTARTHKHNTNSAALQTARCLKKELQAGTRQIKNSIEDREEKKMAREEDARTRAT